MNSEKKIEHKIAAIDIGTNSAHLVIAELDEQEHIHVIDTDKITIRLGSYLDQDGNLGPLGLQKAIVALLQMNELCQSYQTQPRVVATHAMREAKNSHLVTDAIFQKTGLHVEIIDGLEEARLIYLGVNHAFSLGEKKTLVMDIGGGSTEVILGVRENYHYMTSLKLGAVTLSEKFFRAGMSLADEAKLLDFVQLRLAPLHHELDQLQHDTAIFCSGTAKAMLHIYYRKMLGERIDDYNGRAIPREAIQQIAKKLLELADTQKIERYTGLSQSRSEIILAGAVILNEITSLLNVKKWVYSDFALREGLVIDTYRRQQGTTNIQGNQEFRWTRLLSVARRMRVDEEHAKDVVDLSTIIYKKLWPQLPIQKELRDQLSWGELLRGSALLHEIGKIISFPKFHLHSDYILQHNRVLGFTQNERLIMGLIIRLHRKGLKLKPTDAFFELETETRKAVLALAAVLRFASAACRLRENRIESIHLEKSDKVLTFLLKPRGKYLLNVELKKLNDDREIFEKSWGSPVQFLQET
jgi:exopolyphosphatase/guanosine-5'-triphosphate,3'-diphosphate pyrophosphatase